MVRPAGWGAAAYAHSVRLCDTHLISRTRCGLFVLIEAVVEALDTAGREFRGSGGAAVTPHMLATPRR